MQGEGKSKNKCTYMVSNVSDRLVQTFSTAVDDVCNVALVDLDVVAKGIAKGLNLHIISVGTSASHLLQVSLKDAVDVCLRRGREVIASIGIPSGILPLWVTSKSTARVYVNELLEQVRVLTHVFDDAGADLVVGALVAINLIGQGIEEAVS